MSQTPRQHRWLYSSFHGFQALWIACLLALSAFAAGAVQAQRTPGRIAVAGIYPTGYAGLLARYGLSHDILLDYQLADPDIVSRYDLVIIAGYSPIGSRMPATACARMLEAGGSILLDYSGPSHILAYQLAAYRNIPVTPRWKQPVKLPFFLNDGQNPLSEGVDVSEKLQTTRGGFVPTLLDAAHATIFATYGQPRRERNQADAAAVLQPAIALERYGKGKILHCGPSLGMATSLSGMDCDKLVLNMIRLLTDGRAQPQLEPEGPHLGRKESIRSLHLASETPDETPAAPEAPARPNGPGAAGKLPAGSVLIEAEPATEFNLTGQMNERGGDLLLNYWNSANFLRVRLTPNTLRVSQISGKRERVLAAAKQHPGATANFTIKERRDRLTVIAGPASVSTALHGICQGQLAARGLGEVHYQPVEPPYFSDDFMRTSDDNGGWETTGGAWKTAPVQNPDLGANPFSYRVEATGPATALTGYPFWDDYRFSVSARPESGHGSIGLGLYAQDAANMILFRARLRKAGEEPTADGFTLARLVNGKEQVLARSRGGLSLGQWYRLQMRAQGAWIGVYVDGVKVLAARDTTFAGGEIALRAEDAATRFDDVLLEPANAPNDSGVRLGGSVLPFAGIIDLASWAGPAVPWDAAPDTPGLFWRRGSFYGDTGLRFALPPLSQNAQAMLLLDGDGQQIASGYSLLLRRDGSGARLELQHEGKLLAQAKVAKADQELILGLRRKDNRVIGMVNDLPLVSASIKPGERGRRLAFRAVGFRPRITSLAVWSANMRDYTFDTAPVDWWVGSGDWDLTNRWSCTPDWSWFGGYSDADVAAIWHKQPLQGDAVLDFYAGPMMISVGKNKKEQFADLNAVLCGDGKSTENGYSFLVGPNGRGARILRNGAVVAQDDNFRFFAQGHNRWANVRVEKHGGRIQLFVEGQLVLQYDDPEPLKEGYAGIWTQRNGIMVPRITLYYEKAAGPLLSFS